MMIYFILIEPGRPENLRAERPSSYTIRVSWDPPANEMYVQAYRVYYQPNYRMYGSVQYALDETIDAPASSYILNPADPYYGYSFIVQAQSVSGVWGDLSQDLWIDKYTTTTGTGKSLQEVMQFKMIEL